MSSSSSSATAYGSRSPSPHTPESSADSFDIAQQDIDIASWYTPEHDKSAFLQFAWNPESLFQPAKSEDDAMLQLDDLIESHAYDDSPSVNVESPRTMRSPTSPSNISFTQSAPQTSPTLQCNPSFLSLGSSSMALTKPIPPPASVPRRQDPLAMNHKVVYPPRESCVNLPIMFPSIPESGTKSRVETQIRVTVDLADPSASPDLNRYDRVGSWKWLKLPPGTATKRRTRKQGKIDPDPLDVLHLSVSVTCASPPHNPVLSCSSCRAREAKRVAKKLAARVRPSRSDSESGDDPNKKPCKSSQREDASSIIQFNCSEVVDFSTGSVVLPLRITCYCRHHREKVGFHVHFTMMDHTGRIVAAGSSRPIMITDDHKTSTTKHNDLSSTFSPPDFEWAQFTGSRGESSVDSRAPSKRQKDAPTGTGGKKRSKPYDSASKPNRLTDAPASSEPSPSLSHVTLPSTRSPTPPSFTFLDATISSHPPPLHYSSFESESSPDSLMTPAEHNMDVSMTSAATESDFSVPSPDAAPLTPPAVIMPSHPHPLPFLFFDHNIPCQPVPPPLPTIHRLVPNCGPTHGGIEVTILGANFHPALTLNCIFGDIAASSTQRWSDNTLVCVLPPRADAGVVPVWIDGFQKFEENNGVPSPLFTYSDESDRALMELALQVVGLKMTGKIEEAKNIAMRIVGNAGESDSNGSGSAPNAMQFSSQATRDLRPLLFIRAGETENFESLMIDFLSIMDTPVDSNEMGISTPDAVSHQSASGQTLLHLASFLGFSSLACFLVNHGADLNVRDRNGYTPLHFAALSRSQEVVRCLVNAGADLEIVDATGKTAQEITSADMFDGLPSASMANVYSNHSDEDEEAEWGDGEEDAVVVRKRSIRVLNRRRGRFVDSSRREKTRPTSPTSDRKRRLSFLDSEKLPPSFTELIQKTLAQLPGSPHLPHIHLPHIKGLPAVPWGALPQIPVLPVVIPLIPGLPGFLSGGNNINGGDSHGKGKFNSIELRAAWERWLVASSMKEAESEPPPEYTPRAEPEAGPSTSKSAPVSETVDVARSESRVATPRRFDYGTTPVTEQEVNAYTYEAKSHRKQDRMLMLFWLPILVISLIWACHNGVRFALGALRGIIISLRTGMRT